MCGIFASISKRSFVLPTPYLKQSLGSRGPDHLGEIATKTGTDAAATRIFFTSTVLALRGGQVTKQPLSDPFTGSILCWNGEAWRIGQELITGNDGQTVLNLLIKGTSDLSQPDSISHVLKVVRSISGPFSFIYFDQSHNLLFFGRDCLGRRSLLYDSEDIPDTVQFSSIAGSTSGTWREVEADGIYVLTLVNPSEPTTFVTLAEDVSQMSTFQVQVHPYKTQGESSISLRILNPALPCEAFDLSLHSSSVRQLEFQLYESLKLRVLNIPSPPVPTAIEEVRFAVLFSGGLDCTVLARIAHDIVPANQPIDLLNVAFENPRVIQAARRRPGATDQVNQTSQNRKAIDGVHEIPLLTDTCEMNPSAVAASDLKWVYESCPDRITGRNALRELQRVCPKRKWNFVTIDVPYTETICHRAKVVGLIYPHNTEMDLSISYALYFAARGTGVVDTNDILGRTRYTTPARVLISGLGADELFGGYTRHSVAFTRHGFPGLIGELELDVNRLGKRNLGRDDRVIANWGREARFPYLDESLVGWALDCPLWGKCGFGAKELGGQDGEPVLPPDKKVLRLLAWKLGMHSVAREKKRAIQFGARTAKMETGKTRGTSPIS